MLLQGRQLLWIDPSYSIELLLGVVLFVFD
jgi:hypothetical protein